MLLATIVIFQQLISGKVLANKQDIDCERLNDMSGDNIFDNDLLKDTFLMAVTADHESLIRFTRAV
ncbi:MAG: hypothetical protein ABGX41_14345 [Pseudohongiella sp.]